MKKFAFVRRYTAVQIVWVQAETATLARRKLEGEGADDATDLEVIFGSRKIRRIPRHDN